MKTKTKISVFSAVFLMIFTGTLLARGFGHPWGGMHLRNPLLRAPWERVLVIADEINLTDEQLSQLKEIRSEFRNDIAPLETRRFNLKATLEELMDGAGDDVKPEAKKILKSLFETQYQIAEKSLDARFEIMSILTDEQKVSIKKLRSEMKRNHRFRGKRKGRNCRYFSRDEGSGME